MIFLGNVGEEGEGDLRGVRRLYSQSALAGRIAAHIVLDGAGADSAVTQALGSRRYRVSRHRPGRAQLYRRGNAQPHRRAGLGAGRAGRDPTAGGAADDAESGDDQRRHQRQLHPGERAGHRRFPLHQHGASCCGWRLRCIAPWKMPWSIATRRQKRLARTVGACWLSRSITIGDRPAAQLPADSPLLEALSAVDRHLGLKTELRLGSTDANIPLSLGIPALSMGAGGEGGGAHTLAEWYSAQGSRDGAETSVAPDAGYGGVGRGAVGRYVPGTS